MIAPDEFAGVIEKTDNLRGALEIPVPAGFHVNQMKRELEEVSDKLNGFTLRKKTKIHG